MSSNSKYEPYYDQVVQLRIKRATWAEIVKQLKEAGCPSPSVTGVFQWFVRRRAKERELLKEYREYQEWAEMQKQLREQGSQDPSEKSPVPPQSKPSEAPASPEPQPNKPRASWLPKMEDQEPELTDQDLSVDPINLPGQKDQN
jgi:hypothetical protein